MALTDGLTAIGDAIREKTGTTDLIPFADMPQAIRNIQSGSNTVDEIACDKAGTLISTGYGTKTNDGLALFGLIGISNYGGGIKRDFVVGVSQDALKTSGITAGAMKSGTVEYKGQTWYWRTCGVINDNYTTGGEVTPYELGSYNSNDISGDIAMQLLDYYYRVGESEFWNTYQDNGNRTNYSFGFSGNGWTDETFDPRYDIKPTSATRMFEQCAITNLKSKLEARAIVLDFSNMSTGSYLFQSSSITDVGVLDFSAMPNLSTMLINAKLVDIEKLILKNDGSQTFANAFNYMSALVHCIVEGVIGADFDIRWSTKLDQPSIVSIINALSSTTEGLKVGLSLTAVNIAFETTEGAKDGSTSDKWLNLIANKTNWTITLS